MSADRDVQPICSTEAGMLFRMAQKWYRHTGFSHTLIKSLVFGRCTHAFNSNSIQFDALTVPRASEDDLADYNALLRLRDECSGMSAEAKNQKWGQFLKRRQQRQQRQQRQ